MAGDDFIDEDLQNREAGRRRTAPADDPQAGHVLNRPVSDLNLTRMSRHRDELESQVAASAQELDLLRMRQEELERERRELEDLRKKQEEYMTARRELTDCLSQSLVMMEKEQVRSEGIVNLLASHRTRFKTMQSEIEEIDESAWPEDRVRDELTTALAILDECRLEYNTAIAKIDGAMSDTSRAVDLKSAGAPQGNAAEHTFGFWFKAGLAATLPLVIFLAVLAAVFAYLQHLEWF